MKVAIVGAGAMGGLWAARLAAAGNAVSVVDVSPDVVSAITNLGLVLQSGEVIETARVRATGNPGAIGLVDVVFFFTKAQHTAGAAALARVLIGPDTTVVSLQNGWGNADVLARICAPAQFVIGVTYHSATVLAPGRVVHTGKGATFVGPYGDDASVERGRAVGALLTQAGLDATVTPSVKTEIWNKLVLNAATLPTAALTGLRSGELGQPGPLRDVVDALALEAVAVARGLGYAIEARERVERIHAVLAGAGPGKASMLQDVEARRKTEIEVINGAVVRAAERLGIAAPLNQAMVALIGGLERGWAR